MNHLQHTHTTIDPKHEQRAHHSTADNPIRNHAEETARTKELRSHLCITIEWSAPPPCYLPVMTGGGSAHAAPVGTLAVAGDSSC